VVEATKLFAALSRNGNAHFQFLEVAIEKTSQFIKPQEVNLNKNVCFTEQKFIIYTADRFKQHLIFRIAYFFK
jgi:hypothetical protein